MWIIADPANGTAEMFGWSLDHVLGWTFGGVGWFITALLGGLLAGGLVLASRRVEVASEERPARGREAA